MNQNVTIPVGKNETFQINVFDGPNGTGNNITAQCSFEVSTSDPSKVTVQPTGPLGGYFITGVALGTAVITRKATNGGGTLTEQDTVTVTQPGPQSMTAPYSPPQ